MFGKRMMKNTYLPKNEHLTRIWSGILALLNKSSNFYLSCLQCKYLNPNCNKMFIFGKEAFFIMIFKQIP